MHSTKAPHGLANNFNYIAFGHSGYLEDAESSLEMSKGRMFEYTAPDLEKRLDNFSPDAIKFLEGLPTFLCSEIGTASKPMPGKLVQISVKFGRVSLIQAAEKEIFAHFSTALDFGEVTFGNPEEARSVFGASKLQLFRTHWAVMQGDFIEILSKLTSKKPALASEVERVIHLKNTQPASSPPARRKNILGEAASVTEFLKLLDSASTSPTSVQFYRGHSNEAYELTPSLFRKWAAGGWRHMPHEDRLCKELVIAHPEEFQNDAHCFDRLVRMQHYGLPTRLLDITENPLVALFFACHGARSDTQTSGEVIIFQIEEKIIRYYDDSIVSCIANLSNLSYEQKNKIDLSVDIDAFNRQESILSLLHRVRSENGQYDQALEPATLSSIVCVRAKKANNRIRSQSGSFLLFGHEALLSEFGAEGIAILRITVANKDIILKQLDLLNINSRTVYPSIEETARHLKARYEQPNEI